MTKQATRQISRRVERFRNIFTESAPTKGWVHAIRSALGMTLEQLASKTNVSYQSIQHIERTELKGSPTLKTMKSVAEACNCRFVYAFIPEQPLEKMIDLQAEKKAKEIIDQVSHSMMLENQALNEREITLQIKELKEDLKQGNLRKIWS
ncbi:MAG: mobile mystery protein A [Alphaproteobacteria bacterium]